MKGSVVRYLVSEAITDENRKLRIGMSLFDKLCREARGSAKGILLVPTINNLDEGTSLESFLTRYNSGEIVEDLRNDIDVLLPCGVPFSLRTTRTFDNLSEKVIVLSVHANQNILSKIDESDNVKAVIVVSGIKSQVEQWKEQQSPKIATDY
jgi:hypothetical protein